METTCRHVYNTAGKKLGIRLLLRLEMFSYTLHDDSMKSAVGCAHQSMSRGSCCVNCQSMGLPVLRGMRSHDMLPCTKYSREQDNGNSALYGDAWVMVAIHSVLYSLLDATACRHVMPCLYVAANPIYICNTVCCSILSFMQQTTHTTKCV